MNVNSLSARLSSMLESFQLRGASARRFGKPEAGSDFKRWAKLTQEAIDYVGQGTAMPQVCACSSEDCKINGCSIVRQKSKASSASTSASNSVASYLDPNKIYISIPRPGNLTCVDDLSVEQLKAIVDQSHKDLSIAIGSLLYRIGQTE